MKYLGPRPVNPRDGVEWLRQATLILIQRPVPFLAAAILAPAGTVILLGFPVWEITLPVSGGWLPVVATVVCYGLPLSVAVTLANGLARSVVLERPFLIQHLMTKTVLRVLGRTSLFLFALLLQAYLAVYLLQSVLTPVTQPSPDKQPAILFFGMAQTILGTQLKTFGGLLLVLQLLFACFVPSLHLFREVPLFLSWQLSFRAMQLNPWLGLGLGLGGLLLILLASFETLSIVAQIVALPLPAYLGILLYVAWSDVFPVSTDDHAEK